MHCAAKLQRLRYSLRARFGVAILTGCGTKAALTGKPRVGPLSSSSDSDMIRMPKVGHVLPQEYAGKNSRN
jgi:hypothetical protein